MATMRWFGLALLSVSFSAAGIAQVPAALSVPSIETYYEAYPGIPGRLEPYGKYSFRNLSKAAVVAVHFTYGCDTRLKQSQVNDSLVESGFRSVNYLETAKTQVGNADVLTCPGGIDAASFADGHQEGDSAKLDLIHSQRAGALKAIAFAMPLLEDVAQSEANQPHALIALNNKLHHAGQDRSLSVGEWLGEIWVLGEVADALVQERTFMVPTLRQQPPEQNIQHVMSSDGVNRTRATAIVLRRELEDWQKLLEGHPVVHEPEPPSIVCPTPRKASSAVSEVR